MNKERKKEDREKKVFIFFLNELKLPNDSSLIENRKPPEPDILYDHPDEGITAFELAEICSPEMAKLRAMAPSECHSIRVSDPSLRIVKSKLLKNYKTDYPIELLCYTAGNTVSSDDLVIENIQMLHWNQSKFQKIWFLGDKLYKLDI